MRDVGGFVGREAWVSLPLNYLPLFPVAVTAKIWALPSPAPYLHCFPFPAQGHFTHFCQIAFPKYSSSRSHRLKTLLWPPVNLKITPRPFGLAFRAPQHLPLLPFSPCFSALLVTFAPIKLNYILCLDYTSPLPSSVVTLLHCSFCRILLVLQDHILPIF